MGMMSFTTPFEFLFTKGAFKQSESRPVSFNAFSTVRAFNKNHEHTNAHQLLMIEAVVWIPKHEAMYSIADVES